MSKVIEKTTEKLPKYVRRLTGGTYEARKMINGRTIRVSGKNLTEVMLEFENTGKLYSKDHKKIKRRKYHHSL